MRSHVHSDSKVLYNEIFHSEFRDVITVRPHSELAQVIAWLVLFVLMVQCIGLTNVCVLQIKENFISFSSNKWT